jgi:hypothetical protein
MNNFIKSNEDFTIAVQLHLTGQGHLPRAATLLLGWLRDSPMFICGRGMERGQCMSLRGQQGLRTAYVHTCRVARTSNVTSSHVSGGMSVPPRPKVINFLN